MTYDNRAWVTEPDPMAGPGRTRTGLERLLICEQCGAVVGATRTGLHDEWHRRHAR